MSIALGDRVIAIETYKHPIGELIQTAEDVGGFRMLRRTEYRPSDLVVQPPTERLDKLRLGPDVPVFYILRMQKQR